MRQRRIYVDTSVVGGCFDPEFEDASRAVMRMGQSGEAVFLISDTLLAELEDAPDRIRAVLSELPSGSFREATITDQVVELFRSYMAEKIVGPASKNDAMHVATATVHRADVIVSWNFKHLVHVDKIRLFNAVNLRLGYHTIDIRSPEEVRSHGD